MYSWPPLMPKLIFYYGNKFHFLSPIFLIFCISFFPQALIFVLFCEIVITFCFIKKSLIHYPFTTHPAIFQPWSNLLFSAWFRMIRGREQIITQISVMWIKRTFSVTGCDNASVGTIKLNYVLLGWFLQWSSTKFNLYSTNNKSL